MRELMSAVEQYRMLMRGPVGFDEGKAIVFKELVETRKRFPGFITSRGIEEKWIKVKETTDPRALYDFYRLLTNDQTNLHKLRRTLQLEDTEQEKVDFENYKIEARRRATRADRQTPMYDSQRKRTDEDDPDPGSYHKQGRGGSGGGPTGGSMESIHRTPLRGV